LVALALIFSIQQCDPAPFYLFGKIIYIYIYNLIIYLFFFFFFFFFFFYIFFFFKFLKNIINKFLTKIILKHNYIDEIDANLDAAHRKAVAGELYILLI